MKKLTITFFLLLLLQSSIDAQNIHVYGGVNLSNLIIKNTTNPELDFEYNTGFNFGVGGEYSIYKFLSIETTLQLNSKGFIRTKNEVDADFIFRKEHFLYLDIPTHLKFRFDVANVNIFGLLGGYGGAGLEVWRSVKRTPPAESSSSKGQWWGNLSNAQIKRFDLGWSVGGGLSWKGFTFRTIYLHGVRDIFNDSNPNVGTHRPGYHRAISNSIGYTFNLNK